MFYFKNRLNVGVFDIILPKNAGRIMTEAIGESLDGAEVYDFIREERTFSERGDQKASESSKTSRVFNSVFKSSYSLHDADVSSHGFIDEIQYAMGDERLGALVYDVLMENGLGQYEKHLGEGAFGSVFQIEGMGKFEGKKLALKLIPQAPDWWLWVQSNILNFEQSSSSDRKNTLVSALDQAFVVDLEKIVEIWKKAHAKDGGDSYTGSSYFSSPMTYKEMGSGNISTFDRMFMGAWLSNKVTKNGVTGDGIALDFPEGGSLSSAYGVLLFDGENVQYVESIDPEIHEGNSIIGVVSLAIQGGTLADRVEKLPLDAEAVTGFGKSLAEAVHELHGIGYTHGDLHMHNILLDGEKHHPYALKLIDFGLARKTSKSGINLDWEYFVDVMEYLYISSKGVSALSLGTSLSYEFLDQGSNVFV